jgi:Pyrimidine dimer DNA glycosylase
MQTFLPYPSFRETAQVLDYKRLGKQRVEAWQVLKALRGETKGWRNHPAVLMWAGYESALKEYGREMCIEWSARGYTDNMLERFNYDGRVILPSWLGERRLHLSHQSNLIRKNPEYYSDKFPNVSPDMPYYWVTKENNNG